MLVLEREDDISCGTTKSNNGMIHSGYDSKHGSLKAEMNVKGNAMYTQWAQDLHFAFKRTGSFVLAFDEKEHEVLKYYLENGTKNGVPGIALITGEEARKIEPNIRNRGGKGVKCYKITEKSGNLIGVKSVVKDDELMLITTEGIIIRIRVNDTALLGRVTSGVKLIDLKSGVTVASIARVVYAIWML